MKNSESVAEKIMGKLIKYARVKIACNHRKKYDCFSFQKNKIKSLVENQMPITFILPAFPAKSPNHEKTQGVLPDLGEYLALDFLNDICTKIEKIYPVGANIIICSDGRVFNDLVNVSDANVNAYAAEMQRIIKVRNLHNLSLFSLDDCYYNLNYTTMRDRLLNDYSEDLSIIKNRAQMDEESKLLFNGIHRFIFEDQLVHSVSLSKNQIRQQAKDIAYQAIQRSNAWGNLLKNAFPNAVRLSIHPQLCGSEKFGIMLLKSKNVWATPWHSVVLKKANQFLLIKKKEAEQLQAKKIFIANQFSHYAI